ncbi:MAG: hypothetical protein MUC96_33425 [Myxococcaceae bacterium]|nr:hypothetical protein [Myxococcaceae bacterium]
MSAGDGKTEDSGAANAPESSSIQEPTALEERRQDVEQRIAELEAKLSRPSNVGVTPLVAAVALAFSAYLVWGQRADLEYQFLAPREPIDLGAEGAYRFDLAQSNRYVQLHGAPSPRGWYFVERNTTVVALGIVDTPIILRRPTLPSEKWTPGQQPAPSPDPRPFTVKGRLLARDEAPLRYADAFTEYEKWSGAPAKWILLQEDKPGGDLGGQAWVAVLVLFAALNAWLLVRGTLRLVSSGR